MRLNDNMMACGRVDTMATAEIKEVIVLGASGGFGTLFSQVGLCCYRVCPVPSERCVDTSGCGAYTFAV